MTARQYLATLQKLGLTVASQRTADMLGISVRQSQRFAAGDNAVPPTLALLLAAYLRHGLPADDE